MILTFVEGAIEDNNYLVYNEQTKNAVLIDCTNPSIDIDDAIEKNNLNLKYLLLTHGHFDHVLGVNYYRKKYGAKSIIHKNDEQIIESINDYLGMTGRYNKHEIPVIDEFFTDKLKVDEDLSFDIFHTPGHTKGSVCFKYKNILFSGDTLFYESYGRVDLPSGAFDEIKTSINNLFKLDDSTIVYPGHGQKTSIGYEKIHNMILRG